MKHTPIVIAALLAFGMAMSPDAISAGPRDPRPTQTDAPETPEEVRARKTQEMEAWLRRLVGRFHEYKGVKSTGIMRPQWKIGETPDGFELTGVVDCVGIGSGHGVHCMFARIVRQEDGPVVADQQDVYTGIAPFLLGINPNASEIQILTTWGGTPHSGLVMGGGGKLTDDTVTWRIPCPSMPAILDCWMNLRINAPADGEHVRITISGSVSGSRGVGAWDYLIPVPEDESSALDGPARIPQMYSDYLDRDKRLRKPR